MVEVQKTRGFFAFLRCADEPSATVRVDKLSLWRRELVLVSANPLRRSCVSSALSLWLRAILLLAKWPLEVVSWFARLLSQSRGRGFDSPLVCGSSGPSKNRNPEAQTYSARSTSTAQLVRLSILCTDTSAERLACTEERARNSLKTDVEPLACSSLQRATCAQQPGTMQLAQTLPWTMRWSSHVTIHIEHRRVHDTLAALM